MTRNTPVMENRFPSRSSRLPFRTAVRSIPSGESSVPMIVEPRHIYRGFPISSDTSRTSGSSGDRERMRRSSERKRDLSQFVSSRPPGV
jgi:hypothetical protein